MTTLTFLRWGAEALALGVLVSILLQDWRWRGVYWYAFPLLAALLLTSRLTTDSPATVLTAAAVNAAFVGGQLLILGLYVRVRFAAPLSAYLGAGDMLYWLALTVFFSPALYVLYHLGSLLLSLIAFLGLRHLLPSPIDNRIPLAGLQAGFLALLLLGSWLLPGLGLPAAESWLLSYLI